MEHIHCNIFTVKSLVQHSKVPGKINSRTFLCITILTGLLSWVIKITFRIENCSPVHNDCWHARLRVSEEVSAHLLSPLFFLLVLIHRSLLLDLSALCLYTCHAAFFPYFEALSVQRLIAFATCICSAPHFILQNEGRVWVPYGGSYQWITSALALIRITLFFSRLELGEDRT